MKPTLLFVFFLLLSYSLVAQLDPKLTKANNLMASNKLPEAFDILTAYQNDHPNDSEVYGLIAWYYWLNKDFPKMRENFQKSKAISTKSVIFTNGFGNFILESYFAEKDYKNFLAVIREESKNLASYDAAMLLARGYRWNQMYDSSIYWSKEGIRLDPNQWHPYYQMGYSYLGLKQLDESEYYLKLAFGVAPKSKFPLNAYPYYYLGLVQLGKGEPQAAKESLDKAIELLILKLKSPQAAYSDNGLLAEGYANRGIVKEILQDFEGSIADLNQAAQMDPLNDGLMPLTIRVEKKLKAKQKMIADDASKVGCFEGDCKNGMGAYRFPTGDVYKGQFVNGTKQGNGVLTFVTGDTYSGTFSNDKLSDGNFTKSDGAVVRFQNGAQVISKENQNINYEDEQSVKKAKKGGFWRALGDVVAGAAVVALAVMEEDSKSTKAAESKPAATPTSTSTQHKVVPCEYRVRWIVYDTYKVLQITNIYRDHPNVNGTGSYGAKDRATVSDRRIDVIATYRDKGWEIRNEDHGDDCH